MLESLLALQLNGALLLALSSCSVLALFLVVYNQRSMAKQAREQLIRHRRLQEDMHAMSKSAVGMGKKVLETERRLRDVLKKQVSIMNSQPEHPSYDQATRLIAMGATQKDLINSCGFSQAEAELLLSLNGHGPSSHGQMH